MVFSDGRMRMASHQDVLESESNQVRARFLAGHSYSGVTGPFLSPICVPNHKNAGKALSSSLAMDGVSSSDGCLKLAD